MQDLKAISDINTITAEEERFTSRFSDFGLLEETMKFFKYAEDVQLEIWKLEVFDWTGLSNFESN
jgi:hypothetical protein